MKKKEKIRALTHNQFQMHIRALEKRKTESITNMFSQAYIYWKEILSQNYCFKRKEIEISMLNALNHSDLIDFTKVIVVVSYKLP